MTQLYMQKLTAFTVATAALFAAGQALAQDGFITTSKPYIVPTNGSPYITRRSSALAIRCP